MFLLDWLSLPPSPPPLSPLILFSLSFLHHHFLPFFFLFSRLIISRKLLDLKGDEGGSYRQDPIQITEKTFQPNQPPTTARSINRDSLSFFFSFFLFEKQKMWLTTKIERITRRVERVYVCGGSPSTVSAAVHLSNLTTSSRHMTHDRQSHHHCRRLSLFFFRFAILWNSIDRFQRGNSFD